MARALLINSVGGREDSSALAARVLFGVLGLLLASLLLFGLAWPRLQRVGRLAR